MDDQTTVAQPIETAKQTMSPQKSKGKSITMALLAIILMGGAAYGTYYWQHKKVTDLNTKINNLNSQISSLNKQIADSKQSTQTIAPTITVNHASRFELFSSGTKDYVAINVSIKNASSSAVKLATTDFKLKDAQNNVYKSYMDVLNGHADDSAIQQALPSGDTLFSDQSLAAGESVNGSLVFSAANTLSTFSLVYGSNTYKVTVK